MKGINSEEILTCLLLVAIGYFIAKMFSRSSGNGFSIGGKTITCSDAIDGGWFGADSPGNVILKEAPHIKNILTDVIPMTCIGQGILKHILVI